MNQKFINFKEKRYDKELNWQGVEGLPNLDHFFT